MLVPADVNMGHVCVVLWGVSEQGGTYACAQWWTWTRLCEWTRDCSLETLTLSSLNRRSAALKSNE